MSYYLQDNPNPNTAQFGWPRKKVSGVVGVHTAENNTDFEGADPGAEDVARFIGRRTDYGSYHAIADADSRIKLVHPSYAAWADTENNPHAMSVSGAMQAARWRELTPERAAAITRNMAYAAAELVQDAVAAGLLASPTPARRITPAEAIAGSKAGFYGHGETNPGRRYDPGQNFDWNLFLTTYASAIGGLAAQGTTTTEPTPQEEPLVPNESDKVFYHLDGGEKVSLNEFLNDLVREARSARAATQALLSVQLPDPSEPGKTYSLADYIVWGATNAKNAAGAAGVAAGNTSPEALAKAVTEAQTGATAQAIADQLVISVKE